MGKFVFICLLGVLITIPVPYAAVPSWAWGLTATVVGALVVIWSVHAATSAIAPAQPQTTTPLCLAFLAVLFWSYFQTTSVSPMSWHHPFWADIANNLHIRFAGAITLDPERGTESLLRLCIYGGVFWLCVQYGQDPRNAKLIVRVIAATATAYAAYGLLVYSSGNNYILWFPKTSYQGDLTSTFVNRNNFATYVGIGYICTLGLLYVDYTQMVGRASGRSELVRGALIFIERRGWIYLLSLLLLLGALLYSHSRAGLASTSAGVVVLCLSLGLSPATDKRFVRRFGLACILIAILFFVISGRVVNQRIGTLDITSDERLKVYQLTMEAISDQPILGTGLGTFEEVFRFYRTSDIHAVYDYAHNTYLETALELGLPAAFLLLLCLSVIVIRIFNGVRIRRRDEIYACLGLAAATLVGLHSLVDFSVQIPAVAVTFYGLLGTAFAQSWSRGTRR